MNLGRLLKNARGTKLWSFGLPWLGIILFVLFYFPANQKSSILNSAEREVTTLSEMLAFSVSEGLAENNFVLIQTAFDWSKRDSNIVYISILDERDSVIFEYNPKERQVDRAKLLRQP
ncbi:MAG: methyl-accepting chemotaxis protein, partial [bacterium]